MGLDYSYRFRPIYTKLRPVPLAIPVADGVEEIHTVKFKCIGANRDSAAQCVLSELAELDPNELSDIIVKLKPETSNPYDSKAIAFVCCWPTDGNCTRIGYVVREVLDAVHESIREQRIVKIQFSWVKFRINWIHSGPPGFFVAINITRKKKLASCCM